MLLSTAFSVATDGVTQVISYVLSVLASLALLDALKVLVVIIIVASLLREIFTRK